MTRDFSLDVIARALGVAPPLGAASIRIAEVGTDTRKLAPGSLFVALRGERFDGHLFLAEAARAGAVAALVDAAGAVSSELPCLVVPDTLRALGDLAAFARREAGGEVVAVTGSNGKTTTKEMLAALLATRGRVHKTSGNFNNLIGLPLTLLSWPRDCLTAVVELGMSARGEILRLTEIAAPDVGVITMVGPAHLADLGTLENIAAAKAELFEAMPKGATGVINLDDEPLCRAALPALKDRARLTFGKDRAADVCIEASLPSARGLKLRLAVLGKALQVELPLVGAHNAHNAAAAVAVGVALGLELDAMAEGLAATSLPFGRVAFVRRPGGVSYIDDTYNANPASVRAGLLTLVSVALGRRVAVLGDMLELGPRAEELHQEIGSFAVTAGCALVFALGEQAEAVVEGARAKGGAAFAFAEVEDLIAALMTELRAGDFVLVKGSRGMRMERVVAHLAEIS